MPGGLPIAQREILGKFPSGIAVANALSELLIRDGYLFEVDANERSITHRFGIYLQAELPEWAVDCEFNRDGIEPKRLGYIDLYPESDDTDAKTVFPDVIVHQRGGRQNHMVIEFKKSTNGGDRKFDRWKLEGYKRQLGYTYALFIELGTGNQASIKEISWI